MSLPLIIALIPDLILILGALIKVNIHAPLDNMVAPVSALQPVEAGWQEILTPPMGHVSILFHRPTAKLAGKIIASNRVSSQEQVE